MQKLIFIVNFFNFLLKTSYNLEFQPTQTPNTPF